MKSIMMLLAGLALVISTLAEDKNPAELDQLKSAYQAQAKVAMDPINKKYMAQLDELKKKLGGKGDLEGAQRVQKEIEAVVLMDKKDSANLLYSMEWDGKIGMEKTEAGLILKSSGGDFEKLKTNETFKPPFTVKIKVQTDSTNIRLYYNKGRIIFNWECRQDELRVEDILTSQFLAVAGKGFLKPNKMHDIIIEVQKDSIILKADGKECYKGKGDYKDIEAPVGIGPCLGSKITVKEFIIDKK
jgi:hypothetical protein